MGDMLIKWCCLFVELRDLEMNRDSQKTNWIEW